MYYLNISFSGELFVCRSRGAETSTCEVGSLQEVSYSILHLCESVFIHYMLNIWLDCCTFMKDVQKSLLIRGKKRKKRKRSFMVRTKWIWKKGTRERGISSSCSPSLFYYLMVFDMVVHTVENMMTKVKIPQKTNRLRNVAEGKKVEPIGLPLLKL